MPWYGIVAIIGAVAVAFNEGDELFSPNGGGANLLPLAALGLAAYVVLKK